MKKSEKIVKNINANNEIMKSINKINYYSIDKFIADAIRYAKAIKSGRMLCNIESVSNSGMSRNIRFLECSKGKTMYHYLTFWSFFKAMGYSETGKYKASFRISGCGMDMIFHTNYTIIHRLYRLGFITKSECDNLAQLTPTVV